MGHKNSRNQKSSSLYGFEPFTSYHTETNMVFLHYLLDVFYECAALYWCLINNEYAHKYKMNVRS